MQREEGRQQVLCIDQQSDAVHNRVIRIASAYHVSMNLDLHKRFYLQILSNISTSYPANGNLSLVFKSMIMQPNTFIQFQDRKLLLFNKVVVLFYCNVFTRKKKLQEQN